MSTLRAIVLRSVYMLGRALLQRALIDRVGQVELGHMLEADNHCLSRLRAIPTSVYKGDQG